MIELVPIEKLAPSHDNPRRELGDVAEPAASIRAVGILEPLLVTPAEGGAYRVVSGTAAWPRRGRPASLRCRRSSGSSTTASGRS